MTPDLFETPGTPARPGAAPSSLVGRASPAAAGSSPGSERRGTLTDRIRADNARHWAKAFDRARGDARAHVLSCWDLAVAYRLAMPKGAR